jgi:hypothetical protein
VTYIHPLTSYEHPHYNPTAAAKGDVATMRGFVKQGVDPNTGDYDKRTPLHLAASEGLLEVVKFLLDEGGAQVSPVDRCVAQRPPVRDPCARHPLSVILSFLGGIG